MQSISIAMATYNGAEYIREQLNSFLDQMVQPDELVVCDDVSTDNTIDIIKQFQKTAPFEVKLFQNETRLGYGQNFGKALSLCSGDLIFLSDQDDVWFPNKIATICDLTDTNPDKYLFMNDALVTDKNLVSSNHTKIGQIKSAGFKIDNFVQGSCCAIRKELLKIILPIPTDITGHDNWLVQLATYLDVKYIYSTSLQYYRIHEESTSTYFVNKTRKTHILDMVTDRLNSIRKNGYKNSYELELKKLALMYERINMEVSKTSLEISSTSQFNMALQKIQQKQAAFKQRMKLKPKPFFQRTPVAVIMFLKRDYHYHFNGSKSFFRDILFRERIS